MMQTKAIRHGVRAALGAVVLGAVAACGSMTGSGPATTLVDGARGMENFTQVGDADWAAVDGAIQATRGGSQPSYLVTKNSYRNYRLRVEFWSSDDANSGVFLRCQDRTTITDENCYEANIFDQRPDPTYATGAIVKVAKLTAPMQKAGGRWNTYDITVDGTRLVLVLNGVTTADVRDAKLADGPIALQWGRGVVKFRKVELRPL